MIGIKSAQRKDLKRNQIKIGVDNMAANNVPLVPDKIHAKYTPNKQHITVSALDKLSSAFQFEKQNTVIPRLVVENGIAFPENNDNLPP